MSSNLKVRPMKREHSMVHIELSDAEIDFIYTILNNVQLKGAETLKIAASVFAKLEPHLSDRQSKRVTVHES